MFDDFSGVTFSILEPSTTYSVQVYFDDRSVCEFKDIVISYSIAKKIKTC